MFPDAARQPQPSSPVCRLSLRLTAITSFAGPNCLHSSVTPAEPGLNKNMGLGAHGPKDVRHDPRVDGLERAMAEKIHGF